MDRLILYNYIWNWTKVLIFFFFSVDVFSQTYVTWFLQISLVNISNIFVERYVESRMTAIYTLVSDRKWNNCM